MPTVTGATPTAASGLPQALLKGSTTPSPSATTTATPKPSPTTSAPAGQAEPRTTVTSRGSPRTWPHSSRRSTARSRGPRQGRRRPGEAAGHLLGRRDGEVHPRPGHRGRRPDRQRLRRLQPAEQQPAVEQVEIEAVLQVRGSRSTPTPASGWSRWRTRATRMAATLDSKVIVAPQFNEAILNGIDHRRLHHRGARELANQAKFVRCRCPSRSRPARTSAPPSAGSCGSVSSPA